MKLCSPTDPLSPVRSILDSDLQNYRIIILYHFKLMCIHFFFLEFVYLHMENKNTFMLKIKIIVIIMVCMYHFFKPISNLPNF